MVAIGVSLGRRAMVLFLSAIQICKSLKRTSFSKRSITQSERLKMSFGCCVKNIGSKLMSGTCGINCQTFGPM